jgi:hypothetical protein
VSVDYYMGCGKCMKALHVAQNGLGGFTFYSGQPDTMKLLGEFLADHALCQSVMLLPEYVIDREKAPYEARDSHGTLLSDGGDLVCAKCGSDQWIGGGLIEALSGVIYCAKCGTNGPDFSPPK